MSRESEGLQLNPLLNYLILKMQSLLPKLHVLAVMCPPLQETQGYGKEGGLCPALSRRSDWRVGGNRCSVRLSPGWTSSPLDC